MSVLSRQYIIKSGDTLTQIAKREGFVSWRDIYDHPDNADFRAKRPNPDRIFPGDVLMIPFKKTVIVQGTQFRLLMFTNLRLRHEPFAMIFGEKGGIGSVQSYRFQPKPMADSIERALGEDTLERVADVEFKTPEPMTTDRFSGPASFRHEWLEPGRLSICRLDFSGRRKNGTLAPVHASMVTKPDQPIMPVHGEMVLFDHAAVQPALLSKLLPSRAVSGRVS